MSRLQVEFTLRSLSKEDAKHYGLHVEFVSARAPLLDTVTLRVEGKYLFEHTGHKYMNFIKMLEILAKYT